MPVWTLLATTALLLLAPWALMPRRGGPPELTLPLRGLWWVNRLYCGFLHRLETEAAPLPDRGPAILVANHTCGIDNFLLQAGSRRVLGFLIDQNWYDQWLCHIFCRLLGCIPVRRDGRDLGATRAALRALEAGRVVPIFPEGRINPASGRDFLEPRGGAGFLAVHAGVPVVPAYIRGTPTTTDVWRAFFSPSQARVIYGAPIAAETIAAWAGPGRRPDHDAVGRHLMEAVAALRDRSIREVGPFTLQTEDAGDSQS